MVSLSSKGTTSFRVIGLGRIKVVLSSIFLKKRLDTFHLILAVFYLPPLVLKFQILVQKISASDSCKLCRSASFGSINTHLTPVLFTIFGFPRIRFLFNFILFLMLGIRYGLCSNTDLGEAARFQKLPTTIKRQYNTILPNSSSLN